MSKKIQFVVLKVNLKQKINLFCRLFYLWKENIKYKTMHHLGKIGDIINWISEYFINIILAVLKNKVFWIFERQFWNCDKTYFCYLYL